MAIHFRLPRPRRATSRRGARMLLATALTSAAVLIAPAAASATYSAEFVAQCCYMTLEQGDTAQQYFDFKNTGDQTWFRDGAVPIRLGTGNPDGHDSPFYTPGDWISPARPTGLDVASVDPGGVGRFTWTTTAPQAIGSYTEYYTPLAELVNWMTPPDTQYLKYEVIAAQAPILHITASPARVKRGDPIAVSADATDNRAVDHVTFAVGSQVITDTAATQGTSGYSATLGSAELGAGTQSITVTAYDPGGRQSSATSSFEVYEPPPPPPPPPPMSTRIAPFTPLFATLSGRGTRLGSLAGVGSVVGLAPGARLHVVCSLGCVHRVNETRKVSSRGHVKLTLGRPLHLLRTTRVELRASLAGYVTRFQRYRFRRTREGTFAHFVSAGCLASEKPRKVVRCPST
jgi:hypothetical protein